MEEQKLVQEPENKIKKVWKENEAPVSMWILTAVLGLVFGLILSAIIQLILLRIATMPVFTDGGALARQIDFFVNLISFSGYFFGYVIALRLFAKTKLKSFVLGADRTEKVDLKNEVFIILGLYLIGFVASLILSAGKITIRGLSAFEITSVIIISVLFTWMQTSMEEILFRGIPLRLFCKNEISLNKKTITIAIITSLLFMGGHVLNPEVSHKTGYEAVLVLSSYFFSGLLLFLIDILTGNLLPGMLVHMLNNMLCFILIDSTDSVSGGSAIFVDGSLASPLIVVIQTVIAFVPLVVYLCLKHRKSK